MCAKKKTGLRRSWKLAGAPLHAPPLSAEEKELIADSFSVCYDSQVHDIDCHRNMTIPEAKTTESAVQAIMEPLCAYFQVEHERDTIIAVVTGTVAIPLNMVALMTNCPEFLMRGTMAFGLSGEGLWRS